ncbi:hypothetical protein RGQ13_08015 [Thalassotalea psychrophila]|uniref:Secreted protein n=1 Tax=Thalassotalea psychrophila TaxID=3065647 RepID=A0ABY9TYL8_9GAMM|nr:hypothetical protein RGQ13_08015 [Colwelliaceae bacterium SQ149]
MKKIHLSLSFIWILCLLSFGLKAAEENTTPLTDVWVITIDNVNKKAFEQALKAHMQYRVDKGEKLNWDVYTQVIGDQLNTYALRGCCTNWDKISDHNDWSKAAKTSKHWHENVVKYIKHREHFYSKADIDNSSWDTTKTFKYFSVDTLYPKPGEGFEMQASIKAISDAAKQMKWPESWSWNSRIGGKPMLQLVVGHESYADMMPQEKSFFVRLSEQMDSKEKAQELLEEYGGSFSETNYSVWVHRRGLSSPETISKK